MTVVAETKVEEEFCVMTPEGRHWAYSVKGTREEVEADVRFDGGEDLFVGHRTKTITYSPWVARVGGWPGVKDSAPT